MDNNQGLEVFQEFLANAKFEDAFLKSRKVFLWGPVMDDSAKQIVSRLLYLETQDPGKEIQFYINSPGGAVTAGMAILDTMQLISSPVSTICMGLAASMGSMLLAVGEPGRRFVYPNGRVMIHQPSIMGVQGTASDIEITTKEMIKTKNKLAEILGERCGKTTEQILKDFNRDYWMDAQESVEYGIVDGVFEG